MGVGEKEREMRNERGKVRRNWSEIENSGHAPISLTKLKSFSSNFKCKGAK